MNLEKIESKIPVPYTEIERLVRFAANEIDIQGDIEGFYNQTIETIANATFLQKGGEFWLIWDEVKKIALGYIIGYISKDIDNKLVYWCTQAYADKSIRRTKYPKSLWNKVRTSAIERFCKHIIVVSSRNDDAYCRFLGKGWHKYASLLKEDIN